MQQQAIIERLNTFRTCLGVPLTVLARNVGLSVSALSKAIKGDLQLSEATLQRINYYLSQYGF